MSAEEIRNQADQTLAELDARWDAAVAEHQELMERYREIFRVGTKWENREND